MDFYDLIGSRPCHTLYALAVNGAPLKCPVETGHFSGRARLLKWANAHDWITFRPRLGYMRVVHTLMDADGDITVELEDPNV